MGARKRFDPVFYEVLAWRLAKNIGLAGFFGHPCRPNRGFLASQGAKPRFLRCFRGQRGLRLIWAQLGPTWADLSQLGANLAPTWAQLGPTWTQLGPNFGRKSNQMRSTAPSGAFLGPTWADLGRLGANLGPIWPTNVKLGPTCDQLGQQLRANWGSTNEQPKTLYGITSRKVFRDRCRPFAQNS